MNLIIDNTSCALTFSNADTGSVTSTTTSVVRFSGLSVFVTCTTESLKYDVFHSDTVNLIVDGQMWERSGPAGTAQQSFEHIRQQAEAHLGRRLTFALPVPPVLAPEIVSLPCTPEPFCEYLDDDFDVI